MPRADKKFTRKFKNYPKLNLRRLNFASSPNLAKISAKAANLRANFRLFANFSRLVAEIKKPKVEKQVKGKAWR